MEEGLASPRTRPITGPQSYRFGSQTPLIKSRPARFGRQASLHPLLAALLASIFTFLLCHQRSGPRSLPEGYNIVSADFKEAKASSKGRFGGEELLILTPLKDAEPYLEEYFDNLARLEYPKNLITLAFLVSDTNDGTISKLERYAEEISHHEDATQRYRSFTILRKDFSFSLPADVRHAYEFQPTRRSFIARARNYLLTAALNERHAWVLWLDVDVVRYDPHILDDLMGIDKDVVVPNCLWFTQKWQYWGYDRNNWQETEESLAIVEKLDPDHVLVEGYGEFPTKRLHLVDMPTHMGKAYVPLDGVGATFTLVKANVHREGANFPTFAFEGALETEGFAKMVKKMGFEVVGVPGILVFHAMNSL